MTKAFRSASSVEVILDQLLQVLSGTFGAARISIWMPYEAGGRFHQGRTANTEPTPSPPPTSHPEVVQLLDTDNPLELDHPALSNGPGADIAGPFFKATHAVLCVPICSGDQLIAFVILSQELHGKRNGTDDVISSGRLAIMSA